VSQTGTFKNQVNLLEIRLERSELETLMLRS
jgi:hypothetical protein